VWQWISSWKILHKRALLLLFNMIPTAVPAVGVIISALMVTVAAVD
jgi:hypothetical protein